LEGFSVVREGNHYSLVCACVHLHAFADVEFFCYLRYNIGGG
jgi:hypothetical protein